MVERMVFSSGGGRRRICSSEQRVCEQDNLNQNNIHLQPGQLEELGTHGVYCDSAIDLVRTFRSEGKCGLPGAIMVRCIFNAVRRGIPHPTADEAHEIASKILVQRADPQQFFA